MKDNSVSGSCEHWKLDYSIQKKFCKDKSPVSVLIPVMNCHVKGLLLDELQKGGDFSTAAVAFAPHSKEHTAQAGRTSVLPWGRH